MGALELKMFLDVLGDRELTLDHASDVLLRLSELLEVEGHDIESVVARDLSNMIEGDGRAAGQLEEVLGALDCSLDEFTDKTWAEVPEGVELKDVETLIELLADGKVTLEDGKVKISEE